MNEKELRKKLQTAVRKFVDVYVVAPTSETVEKDFHAQDRLGSLLILLKVATNCIMKEGLDLDKEYLSGLDKESWQDHVDILVKSVDTGHLSQKAKEIIRLSRSRKYLLAYFAREVSWISISILSASYISAHVLMRSVFELLVGIATKQTGSMKKRIYQIDFLSVEERKSIHEFWKGLCAWAHPYSRWMRNVCPIFVSYKPMYHSSLCKASLEKIEMLIDLLLVVALEKFEVDKACVLDEIEKYRIDTASLRMFSDRT